MARGLVAEIDYLAFKNNFQVVKKYAPNAKVMTMLKADAYGHGLLNVAFALNEADIFGVACIEEAIQLRSAFIKKKILLLEGILTADEIYPAVSQDLDIVVHTDWQMKLLKNNKYRINAWLKIDTGMHRLGFSIENAFKKYQELKSISNINLIGVMTHFSSSDSNSQKTLEQIKKFESVLKKMKVPIISLCNSAGLLCYPMAHHNCVRPGIMIYGSSPISGVSAEDLGLLPAMTLKAKIIAKHQVKKGEKIGYKELYTCPEDMIIGILAIGYGDGFPVRASNKATVILRSKKIPIIGRVAMDMLAIDLRKVPKALIGEEVIIWGKEKGVDTLAKEIDMISYELLTSLSVRVTRVKKNYPNFRGS